MNFVTRAMLIDSIDNKGNTEKIQKLFNQPYKVQIMLLVIYGIEPYTQAHQRLYDSVKTKALRLQIGMCLV